MKDLNDYFTRAGSTLFHYTGIGSVLKIVESKKIFASHAYYLNDSREITYAASVLGDALTKYADCRDNEEADFLREFAEWLQTLKNPYGVFIFSLSEEQSLLSQWRSYTPHGKGVSLGFSAEFVNDLASLHGFRLAKCLYQHHEHFELAKALADKMFVTFRQRKDSIVISKRHPRQKYHGLLEEFREEMLQVLAIMKHPAFEEEREWRVISSYFPSFKGPHLKFREGASMLMPYIEIDFPRSETSKKIFSKVILGPSQDQNLSMAALSSYLSNQGACDSVFNCSIPYRKW